MSEKKEGIIVILSSPSGAGKTTLVKKISSENNFSISISHTTRKPRSYEIDGNHYFFVSNTEFQKLISNEKFIEYAKVFNNYYGSSKDTIKRFSRDSPSQPKPGLFGVPYTIFSTVSFKFFKWKDKKLIPSLHIISVLNLNT